MRFDVLLAVYKDIFFPSLFELLKAEVYINDIKINF
jgi:hypothetical protein